MWYSQEKKMTSVVTGGCREVGSSSGGRKNYKVWWFVCLFVLPYHSFFLFFLGQVDALLITFCYWVYSSLQGVCLLLLKLDL